MTSKFAGNLVASNSVLTLALLKPQHIGSRAKATTAYQLRARNTHLGGSLARASPLESSFGTTETANDKLLRELAGTLISDAS